MRPIELMIGDWVVTSKSRKVIQLTSIDETYDCVTYFDDGGERTISLKSIDPIEIKPEILLLLGFKSSETEIPTYYYKNDITKYIISILFLGDIVRLRIESYGREKQFEFHEFASRDKILFLHELQHALFLCKTDFRISLDKIKQLELQLFV